MRRGLNVALSNVSRLPLCLAEPSLTEVLVVNFVSGLL